MHALSRTPYRMQIGTSGQPDEPRPSGLRWETPSPARTFAALRLCARPCPDLPIPHSPFLTPPPTRVTITHSPETTRTGYTTHAQTTRPHPPATYPTPPLPHRKKPVQNASSTPAPNTHAPAAAKHFGDSVLLQSSQAQRDMPVLWLI